MNINKLYFTADHHFGHINIIKHCNRPFDSVHEMNKVMTKKWNSLIDDSCEVYHLGDIIFRGNKDPDVYLDQLKGKIYLIAGNHDNKKVLRHPRFEWVKDIHYLKFKDSETNLNVKIHLCHYAMKIWRSSNRGAWNLFGHSHGNLIITSGFQMDIGVDTNNFYPYSYKQIRELMQTRNFKSIDHHK